MGKTFRIITLGCKVNQYESAYLSEALVREGCVEAGKDDRADITVVNTCIVTQRAAYQSRQAVRKALRENPGGLTAAIGCYGQVFPEELSGIEGLNLIGGNTSKGMFAHTLMNTGAGDRPVLAREEFHPGMDFEFLPVRGFSGRTRAFLKIQDGCRSFCSYCIVPFARGPLRSLDPSRVLSMLESLSEDGYREVVLTGIHLGKYGIDLSPAMTLKGLLGLVAGKALPMRIRLSSLDPNEMDGELIEMVASESWLCRHFHISLQSGDDGTLHRMNREYRARDFYGIAEHIHRIMPMAAIGVDCMVGFPGEDTRAFGNTFSLVRDLPLTYLHVFPFSPRRGTAAAKMSGQVDQARIKERAAALRRLGREKREAFHRACLGKTFPVLVEGWCREERGMIEGWSDNYLPVAFPSDRLLNNRMIPVRTERLGKGMVIGTAQTGGDHKPDDK